MDPNTGSALSRDPEKQVTVKVVVQNQNGYEGFPIIVTWIIKILIVLLGLNIIVMGIFTLFSVSTCILSGIILMLDFSNSSLIS